MADLTRFDFHAMKFQESEAISMMDASEVGQFVLFMVKAWLLEKDASLPEDPVYLARIGRVPEVSSRVLAEWPVVETEWGPRRQNKILAEEWGRAKQRSEEFAEKANARWGGRLLLGRKKADAQVDAHASAAADAQADAHASAAADAQADAGAYAQSNPIQSIQSNPIQSNPIQPSGGSDGNHESKRQGGDWHTFAVRYKRAFGGKKAGGFFKAKYADACLTYSEDDVLACFEDWAPGAKSWADEKGINQPLHAFFKKLDEAIGDMRAEAQIEQVQATEAESAAVEAKRRQDTEALAQQASIERQTQEIVQRLRAKPDQNEVSLEDFLSEDK